MVASGTGVRVRYVMPSICIGCVKAYQRKAFDDFKRYSTRSIFC